MPERDIESLDVMECGLGARRKFSAVVRPSVGPPLGMSLWSFVEECHNLYYRLPLAPAIKTTAQCN